MKTKRVHDKFFSLLRQLPGADKESIVWQYSCMLTTSLREFYALKPEDYKRMIADMEVKVNELTRRSDQDVKMLRSAILHRLQKHGVDTTDWACVNSFLTQPRIVGKMLFEMSVNEMKALIPKLESILKKDNSVRAGEIRLSEQN